MVDQNYSKKWDSYRRLRNASIIALVSLPVSAAIAAATVEPGLICAPLVVCGIILMAIQFRIMDFEWSVSTNSHWLLHTVSQPSYYEQIYVNQAI
jgi:hypothetical protein